MAMAAEAGFSARVMGCQIWWQQTVDDLLGSQCGAFSYLQSQQWNPTPSPTVCENVARQIPPI